MIKMKALIFLTCLTILIGLSSPAMSKMSIYAQDIDARFEYDNNVTRQRLHEDYQYGIIWRLYTGFSIKNIIPLNGLDTEAKYSLSMRDVNTTNDEDYNTHDIDLKFKIKNKLSFKETFNAVEASIEQPFREKTRLYASYRNEQKWFLNKAPEIRARNFYSHQLGLNIYHSMSSDFSVHIGYVDQIKTYNRRPISFREGRPVVLDGEQRDRQNILILGFQASIFNNTDLFLSNQIINSNSNSRAFNFNGNRTQIIVLSNPISKLSVELVYQLVAYNLGAYQTPDLGYELSETRTDDQSGIKLGLTYYLSKQVSFKVNYEHLSNTVFFTKDFYESNTGSIGMKVKF
jgi:hypothetical protein